LFDYCLFDSQLNMFHGCGGRIMYIIFVIIAKKKKKHFRVVLHFALWV